MVTTTKTISVIILIGVLIIMIIYIIILFECFKNKTFIFETYTPPAPPSNQNGFYPLGTVTPMTQEQIENRNASILASTG